MLVRACLKSCTLGSSILWTKNFQVSKPGLEKAEEQIANICCIIEKASEFQKSFYLYFIDYAKVFDCVDHNKQWKVLKQMGISDHFTCLLRNLYVVQQATVRTLYGTVGWFKFEEGVPQLLCLFNLHAESIMRNARLEELQAVIKIGGRDINNFRYVGDTTLIAEGKEEQKSLLMKVKEESEND